MTDRSSSNRVRDIAHSVVVPSGRVIRSMEVAHIGDRKVPTHDDQAMFELVIENDVVRAIDVTCNCGQKMRLWCSYEAEAGS